MKTYLIKITLRKNILDKAGTAVSKVLIRMGYKVKNLRIGKTIYITTNEDIELIAKSIVNEVMEDFEIECLDDMSRISIQDTGAVPVASTN
jgi:phosphoribosylformylglycinamidine (FGAM) synthase PurS component